jgi:hypothetical protein
MGPDRQNLSYWLRSLLLYHLLAGLIRPSILLAAAASQCVMAREIIG